MLVLFGVLVLRLWTLQVVEGKTYAAAVTRNQVRVVSIPAPRGEIVDRNGTVLVSNIPQEEILLSRAEAAQNPSIIGMVAALVGQTPAQVQASINNNQYSPYEPVPVAVGVSTATVQFLQTHQSEYPGVSVETVAQRTYPQGGTTATHILGYVGDISLELPGRAPQPRATPRAARSACRGSRPSTSRTCGAWTGARRSRSTPAARSSARSARPLPRSATPSCSTSTPGCSRRCRTTCSSRS